MDKQLESARRNFEQSPTLDNWVIFLANMRRAGVAFTAAHLRNALSCSGSGGVSSWEDTPTGFVAHVTYAVKPEIEERYMTHWDDIESYPRWANWTGKVTLDWIDYFMPPGPTLCILVEHFAIPFGFGFRDDQPDHIAIHREILDTEFTYEGDIVTTPNILELALNDPSHWTM